MADIKKQITDWFNSPQDYDQGLELLKSASGKRKLMKKMELKGKTKNNFEKLKYELNKVVGYRTIPTAMVQKPVILKNAPGKNVKKDKKSLDNSEGEKNKFNLIGKNSIDIYPPLVQRLVKENSSLYMLRGKKHAELKRKGDGNDQETIAARGLIIAEIKKISNRLDVLFSAFSDFENKGISIDPAMIWPEENTGNKESGNQESIEDLKIQKKNIQSSITKDRNMLLYQAKTKGNKENPMPAGPKRTTLEKRISKKDAEILEIDQKIADLG